MFVPTALGVYKRSEKSILISIIIMIVTGIQDLFYYFKFHNLHIFPLVKIFLTQNTQNSILPPADGGANGVNPCITL